MKNWHKRWTSTFYIMFFHNIPRLRFLAKLSWWTVLLFTIYANPNWTNISVKLIVIYTKILEAEFGPTWTCVGFLHKKPESSETACVVKLFPQDRIDRNPIEILFGQIMSSWHHICRVSENPKCKGSLEMLFLTFALWTSWYKSFPLGSWGRL